MMNITMTTTPDMTSFILQLFHHILRRSARPLFTKRSAWLWRGSAAVAGWPCCVACVADSKQHWTSTDLGPPHPTPPHLTSNMRLSVLSTSRSSFSPRNSTFSMFSLMMFLTSSTWGRSGRRADTTGGGVQTRHATAAAPSVRQAWP
jgi:hypothetical protein